MQKADLDLELFYLGHEIFCAGVDESGRGPAFGPVFIGIFPFQKELKDLDINDSKKLSAKNRSKYFDILVTMPHGVGSASNFEINEHGLTMALKLSFKRALKMIDTDIDIFMLDGKHNFTGLKNVECLIKGDQKAKSIAAASIIAKVSRDNYINKIVDEYPGYDLENNKGYLTSNHINGLKKYGPTDLHRNLWLRNI